MACWPGSILRTSTIQGSKEKDREIIRLQAQEKRDEIVQAEADYWYDKMQVALSKPPTVITERVLVKATCPVRAADSAGVDDGAPAGTAELDRGLVQNLAKLGDEKEKNLRKMLQHCQCFSGYNSRKTLQVKNIERLGDSLLKCIHGCSRPLILLWVQVLAAFFTCFLSVVKLRLERLS